MQRLAKSFRLEMFKFTLYIFFPVGIFFLYQQPDIASLPLSQKETMDIFKTDPDTLYVIYD
jgi:hypothetical protein